jgi:hypothetical protein
LHSIGADLFLYASDESLKFSRHGFGRAKDEGVKRPCEELAGKVVVSEIILLQEGDDCSQNSHVPKQKLELVCATERGIPLQNQSECTKEIDQAASRRKRLPRDTQLISGNGSSGRETAHIGVKRFEMLRGVIRNEGGVFHKAHEKAAVQVAHRDLIYVVPWNRVEIIP